MDELTIKKVAQLTHLSEFTLRAWEKRYAVVKPRRSASGHRIYGAADVEKLKLLEALVVGSGLHIGKLANLTVSRLKKLQVENFQPEFKQQAHIQFLIQTLKEMNFASFAAYFRHLQMQFETKVFLAEIVAPFLSRLGADVSGGKLDIFHEHAASATVRNVLSGILYFTEQTLDPNTPISIIASTPEGDLHEFGILICSIVAVLNGQRVLYLGPNLPASSLINACRSLKVATLLLGASAPAAAVSVEALQRFSEELEGGLPKSTMVWVGGSRAVQLKTISNARESRVVVIESFAAFDRATQKTQRAARRPS